MIRFAYLLSLALLLGSCAQITPLEGGAKDVTPPGLDTIHSSPFVATNYRPKSIELRFDEWVKLNNVFKNVLVSPPLKKQPQVSLKRKTVIFEFDKDEVLHDSTTYTINFGSAIMDITENNPATGLTYVFSTGPEIDSLSLKGKVLDAFTKKPVEGVKIMLYAELSDSIVYKEKPYYLGITDKAGLFQINNLRSGVMKAFALVDNDFDYKLSQSDEMIGFLSKPITIGKQSPKLLFLLFTERPPAKLKEKKHQANGMKSLVFNQPILEPSFQPIHVDKFYFLPQGDSIKIWYSGVDTSSQLVILSDKKIIDTISLKPSTRLSSIDKALMTTEPKAITLIPTEPAKILFSLPIDSWNDTLIVLSQDSILIHPSMHVSKENPKLLEINYAWNEHSTYLLQIFPKGVMAFNKQAFQDTLTQNINTIPREKLGNILLDLSPPDSSLQYVIRLLLKGKEINKEILSPNQKKVTWNLVKPGDYTLELIEDRYPNGIWDPGIYLQAQQPERVFVKTLEKLRANWDLEVSWAPDEPAQNQTPKEEKDL